MSPRRKRGAALLAEMYADALEIIGESIDLDPLITAEIGLNEDGRPVLQITDQNNCSTEAVVLSMRATFNLLKFLKNNEPDIFALAEGDRDASSPSYAPDGGGTGASAEV